MNLKIISIPYSLIKIRAKAPPPYSILNPETISDSPSAVSKGVRFDSAKQSIIHVKARGATLKAGHIPLCISVRFILL